MKFTIFSLWSNSSRYQNKYFTILILLMIIAVYLQRLKNHELARLVSINTIESKLEINSWRKVGSGLVLMGKYLIKCNRSHERIKIFLPLKGDSETSATLLYGIVGESEVSFPFAKLPYFAEYVFVLDNEKQKSSIPIFIQFNNYNNDYPVFFSKQLEKKIKVVGQDSILQTLNKDVIWPRSHHFFQTFEHCDGVRIVD